MKLLLFPGIQELGTKFVDNVMDYYNILSSTFTEMVYFYLKSKVYYLFVSYLFVIQIPGVLRKLMALKIAKRIMKTTYFFTIKLSRDYKICVPDCFGYALYSLTFIIF